MPSVHGSEYRYVLLDEETGYTTLEMQPTTPGSSHWPGKRST
jgi:hypothetical protein